MFKKTIILVATLLIAGFSSSAFAVEIKAQTTIGGGAFTPSNGVNISIITQATAYAAQSCHMNGTYMYGTGGGANFSGDPTEIKRTDIPSQSSATTECVVTAPTSATALSF